MAKWIKGVLATIVALPVVAAVGVAVLVDPNDYKAEIESLVSDSTGRTFEIKGDIGLSFLPWLGFEVEGLTLANKPSFSVKPMMSIGSAEARLKLLPLFVGKLEIGLVALQDIAVVVGLDKAGEPSWADMVAADAAATEEVAAAEESGTTELPAFSLTAFRVRNASLHWLDQQANSQTVIEPFELEIGSISPNEPFDLLATLELQQGEGAEAVTVDAEWQAKVTLNTSTQKITLSPLALTADVEMSGLKPIEAELSTDVVAALDGSQAAMKNITGDINGLSMEGQILASNLMATPFIDMVLQLGTLNVDDFVLEAEPAEESASTDAAATTAALNSTPVDVSALNSMNAKMAITAERFMASGMQASNFVLNAALKNGLLNVSQMDLDLYEGKLAAVATINAGKTPAAFTWQHQLSGVNAEPMQEDVMEKAYIAGTAQMNTEISTRGATVGELKKSMSGKGSLEFANGAIKGINIAGALRKALAKYKKQPLPEEDAEVLDTDFSSATASFTINQGQLNNPDMLVESPLIRITGAGDVNLVDETLDYRAKPVIVASLEGQGGRSLDDLDGLPIPVRCTGALAEPDCRTDFSGMLKDQAKAALEKEQAALKAKLEADKAEASEKLDAEKKQAEDEARKKLEEKAQDLLNKWR